MDNSLENTNTQGEITGQNAEPEKDDPVKKMEESLGEMMQMNTPGLDLVEPRGASQVHSGPLLPQDARHGHYVPP